LCTCGKSLLRDPEVLETLEVKRVVQGVDIQETEHWFRRVL
jgi:hypothetical protein